MEIVVSLDREADKLAKEGREAIVHMIEETDNLMEQITDESKLHDLAIIRATFVDLLKAYDVGERADQVRLTMIYKRKNIFGLHK